MATYTITIQRNLAWYQIPPSDNSVLQGLSQRLSGYINIITVDSPWFADRDIITFSPVGGASISDMQNAFVAAFQDMGYPQAAVLAIDSGITSSQPGTILASAANAVSSVAQPVAKDAEILVIGAIVVLAIILTLKYKK